MVQESTFELCTLQFACTRRLLAAGPRLCIFLAHLICMWVMQGQERDLLPVLVQVMKSNQPQVCLTPLESAVQADKYMPSQKMIIHVNHMRAPCTSFGVACF